MDNYDSFTYNLANYIWQVEQDCVVMRNDVVDVEEVGDFDALVISPGPGMPDEQGKLMDVLKAHASNKPVLGVCLGLQALVEQTGGVLRNLDEPLHGVSTPCQVLQEDPLFAGMPEQFLVGHYHSWVVDEENLPGEWQVLAKDDQGNIMAIRHQSRSLYGLQFHPESVLSENGLLLMENWIRSI